MARKARRVVRDRERPTKWIPYGNSYRLSSLFCRVPDTIVQVEPRDGRWAVSMRHRLTNRSAYLAEAGGARVKTFKGLPGAKLAAERFSADDRALEQIGAQGATDGAAGGEFPVE